MAPKPLEGLEIGRFCFLGRVQPSEYKKGGPLSSSPKTSLLCSVSANNTQSHKITHCVPPLPQHTPHTPHTPIPTTQTTTTAHPQPPTKSKMSSAEAKPVVVEEKPAEQQQQKPPAAEEEKQPNPFVEILKSIFSCLRKPVLKEFEDAAKDIAKDQVKDEFKDQVKDQVKEQVQDQQQQAQDASTEEPPVANPATKDGVTTTVSAN